MWALSEIFVVKPMKILTKYVKSYANMFIVFAWKW